MSLFGKTRRVARDRSRRLAVKLAMESCEQRLLLSGQTFTVNTVSDNVGGSLRDAITQLNADMNPGTDTIKFAIGSGPATLSFTSPLPAITHAVIIDGTTQPGYVAAPLIELNGAGLAGSPDGLRIDAGDSTIKGLDIVGFGGAAIALTSANNRVQSNVLGVDLNAAGATANGTGVEVAGDQNMIGGLAGNTIANNAVGVHVASGAGNTVVGNALFGNTQAIVVDGGANQDQPAPTLLAAIPYSGGTIVDGTVGGFAAGAEFALDFYASAPGDVLPSTRTYLGSTLVKTDAAGNAPFAFESLIGVPVGQTVTATATSPGGDTSALSAGVVSAADNPFLVTKNSDGGVGSLRQAILNANADSANLSADIISFSILLGSTTIAPQSPLPPITHAVTIDGTTQPTYVGVPAIIITGANIPSAAYGLQLDAGSDGSTIKGLNIVKFAGGAAIDVESGMNRIQSNVLGADPSGAAAGPGNQTGVLVNGPNNIIGGAIAAAGNTIAFNTNAVRVDSGTGNTIEANLIYNNTTSSIVLNSANHANNDQAAPQLISAAPSLGTTRITFATAGLVAGTTLDFYADDPTAVQGPARTYLGSYFVASTPPPTVVFSVPVALSTLAHVVATATSPIHDTSPLSAAVQVINPFQVTTPLDQLGGPNSPISLRQAILNVNNDPSGSADTITFAIGTGPQVIQLDGLLGALPALTHKVVIDGTTQPGYNGSPLIEISGASVAGAAWGLRLDAGDSTIKGLDIVGFAAGAAIDLESDNNQVLSNVLGVDVNGVSGPNGRGVLIAGNDNAVGGTAAQGNTIAHSTTAVDVGSGFDGNTIRANLIYSNSASIVLAPGANGGVQPPSFASAFSSSGHTTIKGTLATPAPLPNGAVVDLYAYSTAADAPARVYLGSAIVPGGSLTFTASLNVSLSTLDNVTATVTQNGNTSQFSSSEAVANPFLVTTAADNGDNLNPIVGSLRQAIVAANADVANGSADTITFAIPGGPPTITLASILPALMHKVVIDGTTQPGYNGTPVVTISGAGAGNAAYGIQLLATANGSTIKGLDIVGFASGAAIDLESDGNQILSNVLGVDINGVSRPNARGVLIAGNNNIVGGTGAAGNTITQSTTAAVDVSSGFNGNAVRANLIYDNGGSSIVLEGTANRGELAPQLASATSNSGTTVVTISGPSYAAGTVLDFYADGTGAGQAPAFRYLGSYTVTSTATPIVASLPVALSTLASITATATAPTHDTSALSAPAVPVTNPFLVINTNDSGFGSLRQAITNANNDTLNLNADTITFAIPGGPATISLTSALPALMHKVVIDGTSQAGYNGTPVVTISGAGAGNAAYGFQLLAGANGSTIKGLDIVGFAGGAAIDIEGNGDTIQSNVLGANPAGTAPGAGNQIGVLVNGSGNTIGGAIATAGNIIAFNANEAVRVDAGSGNTVEANRIYRNGSAIGLAPGANAGVQPPTLASAVSNSGHTTIKGTLAALAPLPNGAVVDFYAYSTAADAPARVYLGSAVVPGGSSTFTASLNVALSTLDNVTATVTENGNTSEFSSSQAVANPFLVTTAADNGDDLNPIPGSLRQAIVTSNADLSNPNADAITFAILSGPTTIAPTVPLPPITRPVVIDGTTQIGYSGAPVIEISGASAPGATYGLQFSTGSGGSTIKGLDIVGFANGAAIDLESDNNQVLSNVLGVDVNGVKYSNARGVLIGGNNNIVGSTAAGGGNTIAFNTVAGVEVLAILANPIRENPISGNLISGNAIFQNTAEIVLTGPANGNQPAPSLASATSSSGKTDIQGNLTGFAANSSFTIEFFGSPSLDSANHGQAVRYLGSTVVATDAAGAASFSVEIAAAIGVGQVITATATSAGKNTSPLSDGVPVSNPFVVTTTDDNGDDLNPIPGSLRQVIEAVNANANGISTITFQIDVKFESALGSGTFIIGVPVNKPLPSIKNPVVLDGTSEATFLGKDAIVELQGIGAPATVNGLVLDPGSGGTAPGKGSMIAGLTLTGFLDAIQVNSCNNTIGGTTAGAGNAIFGNSRAVHVTGAARGNAIQQNSIYNDGADIVLDSGANDNTAAPAITDVASVASLTTIDGQLSGLAAGATYTLEFFTSGGDGGPAEVFLGSVVLHTAADNAAQQQPFTASLALAAALGGKAITATVTGPDNSTSSLSTGVQPVANALAVTNGSDRPVPDSPSAAWGSGIGTGWGTAVGSLRLAIENANAIGVQAAPASITFGITGSSRVITVSSPLPSGKAPNPLPVITVPVIIDGTTQPGVQIDGGDGIFDALTLAGGSGGSVIQGVTITNFHGNGIVVQSAGNTIGGTIAAAAVVIGTNSGAGIRLDGTGANGNLVEGNRIVIVADPNVPGAAKGVGVAIVGGSNNTIGGTTSAQENTIGGYTSNNVSLLSGTGNNVLQNTYLDSYPIPTLSVGDIAVSPTANNGLLPVHVISATLNADGSVSVLLDKYKKADKSAESGRIELYVISQTGTLQFEASLDTALNAERPTDVRFSNLAPLLVRAETNTIFLTVTDPTDGTSAFSNGMTLTDPNVVTNTQPSGAGSLSQVAQSADAGSNILFNIPTSDLNYNSLTQVFTIALQDSVTLTKRVTIDGASEAVFLNQAYVVPIVQIDGGGQKLYGLDDQGPGGSIIENLAIYNCGCAGIRVATTQRGDTIVGNWIGAVPDGVATGNAIGILVESASNVIGGTAAGAPNVIGSNTGAGIELRGAAATDNLVVGNFIGTDPNAKRKLGNQIGILVNGANNNTIGGPTAGDANTIAFNSAAGVKLDQAGTNLLQRNYIGTDAVADNLGNAIGIELVGGAGNAIMANVIAANGGPGVGTAGQGDGIYLSQRALSTLIQGNTIGAYTVGNTTSHGNQGDGIGEETIDGQPFGTTIGGTPSVSALTGVISALGSGANTIVGNGRNGVLISISRLDLQLMSWGDGTAVPTSGSNLLVAGTDNQNVLHIRIFDAAGGVVTDTDETKLPPAQAAAVSNLKPQILALLPPHVLTETEKSRVIGEVRSIIAQAGTADLIEGNQISGNVLNGINVVDDLSGGLASGQSLVTIRANLIGTDDTGTQTYTPSASQQSGTYGNGLSGILLETTATDSLTRGAPSVSVSQNVISGNGLSGVTAQPDFGTATAAANVQIQTNFIGTDIFGTATAFPASGAQLLPLGNVLDGVRLINVSGALVGAGSSGTSVSLNLGQSHGNLISGNLGRGVELDGNVSDNTVAGNLIGVVYATPAAGGPSAYNALSITGPGRSDSGNLSDGVSVLSATGDTVAGNVISGNVVSGNRGYGVHASGGGGVLVMGLTISGNFIGTSRDGMFAVVGAGLNGDGQSFGNGADGVFLDHVKGAPADPQNPAVPIQVSGNVISGNHANGVDLLASTLVSISSNKIGTAADGTGQPGSSRRDFGNGSNGVFLNQSGNNTVGGAIGSTSNIIAGNHGSGIFVSGTSGSGTGSADQNLIAGNYVGMGMIPNAVAGIVLSNASNNVIGSVSGPMRQLAGTQANVISGNSLDGILIVGTSSGNTVAGNRIGTDETGTYAVPNSADGILLLGGAPMGSAPGVPTPANPTAYDVHSNTLSYNTISGNAQNGIQIFGGGASGNIVSNNLIGGGGNLGNGGNGVFLNGDGGHNTVGRGNTISGNGQSGVLVFGTQPPSSNPSDNKVQGGSDTIVGNLIGTDGSSPLTAGNGGNGVFIYGTSGNVVTQNSISGNAQSGVTIFSPAPSAIARSNTITANVIGALSGNQGDGVDILSGQNNIVGGVHTSDRNVISGNNGNGVVITSLSSFVSADNNAILGNYIGVGTDGKTALGNGLNGVLVQGGTGNMIGMAMGGATIPSTTVPMPATTGGNGVGNIIAANKQTGIVFTGATAGNRVQGNYIGVGADGTTALANATGGLLIANGGFNSPDPDRFNITVGGTATGAGNIFGGDGNASGIRIVGLASDTVSSKNLVQGNLIGLGADGRPEGYAIGVEIDNAWGNTIGGPGDTARNIISANALAGVALTGLYSTRNTIQRNYIGTDATGTRRPGDLGHLVERSRTDGVPTSLVDPQYLSYNHIQQFGVYINTPAADIIPGTSTRALWFNTINNQILQNVISGNLMGVNITGVGPASGSAVPAGNNLIVGNKVGTDPSGSVQNPNFEYGVYIENSGFNTVGGSRTAGATNIISANSVAGVMIFGGATQASSLSSQGNSAAASNVISGNTIGLSSGGQRFLPGPQPNTFDVTTTGTPRTPVDRSLQITLGVQRYGVVIIGSSGNAIGGPTADLGNQISTNTTAGVYITRVDLQQNPYSVPANNVVQSNTIQSNGQYGVYRFESPQNPVAQAPTLHANVFGGNLVDLADYIASLNSNTNIPVSKPQPTTSGRTPGGVLRHRPVRKPKRGAGAGSVHRHVPTAQRPRVAALFNHGAKAVSVPHRSATQRG